VNEEFYDSDATFVADPEKGDIYINGRYYDFVKPSSDWNTRYDRDEDVIEDCIGPNEWADNNSDFVILARNLTKRFYYFHEYVEE